MAAFCTSRLWATCPFFTKIGPSFRRRGFSPFTGAVFFSHNIFFGAASYREKGRRKTLAARMGYCRGLSKKHTEIIVRSSEEKRGIEEK